MADPAQRSNLLLRRVAAVAVGILFYSAASPFTPVSWFSQADFVTYLDGPRLVDRVLSPVLVMGAAILHWYIASVAAPLPLTITVPNPGAEVRIRNGQAQMPQNEIIIGLWLPNYFWPGMALEAALLWALRYGPKVVGVWMERTSIAGLIFGVWVIGWNAMPWYRKEQAWALIKDYVIRLIFMEMVDAAFGGGRNRRRRRM
ncbi:hypothetical protein BD289DRAFT_361942 [Coniella lustricola]|uniref:Uncharacterized protein n=1 Tax=Coniella lustricola TaxID=2025994 RepID=A0A2T3AHL4_9PEZI|nr:hypothetical protein BD289DRAFT_361942 [Coniella lustricola]